MDEKVDAIIVDVKPNAKLGTKPNAIEEENMDTNCTYFSTNLRRTS
jgi:hypothetical protein